MPISVTVSGSGAYLGGTPGHPPPTPTYIAKITYDGTDITPVVLLRDAEFVSNVNGLPGSCHFRVRDDGHSFSFEVGRPITLDINGVREWTGFVSRIQRAIPFPAGDTSKTRYWVIDGVDINILFRKRVVFKKSNPRDTSGKTYKYSGTPVADTSAISDLVTNYLDLSMDGIDTSTLVQNVANINVDQNVNAFAGGWTWEQAMNSINRLPAAVYYINPSKQLVWTDVDTVSAPFGLSDTPDHSTTYGYRELELLYDASNLINDYLAWGAGVGSKDMVFSRVTDSASVTTHGEWQDASVTYDVYKQSTIDRIANSWVYGSPSNKRGHKDDKISATLTTYHQGIQAGMKVVFTCTAHGFSDTIPCRQVRITFPTPVNPRYQLTLSHEVDSPWTFFDVYHPKIAFPKFSLNGFTGAAPGPVCTMDDFNRTVSFGTYPVTGTAGWGTGPFGPWTVAWTSNNALTGAYADGVNGYQHLEPGTECDMYVPYTVSTSEPTTWTSRFQTPAVPEDEYQVVYIQFAGDAGGVNNLPGISMNMGYLDPSGGSFQFLGSTPGPTVSFVWLPSTWYTFRYKWDPTTKTTYFKAWQDGNTEPSWLGSYTTTATIGAATTVYLYSASFMVTHAVEVAWDYIEVCGGSGSTSTSIFIDSFDRTVASTTTGPWGTASSGATWVRTSTSGSCSVDGDKGTWTTTGFNTQHLAATGMDASVLSALSGSKVVISGSVSINRIPAGTALDQAVQFTFNFSPTSNGSDNTGFVITIASAAIGVYTPGIYLQTNGGTGGAAHNSSVGYTTWSTSAYPFTFTIDGGSRSASLTVAGQTLTTTMDTHMATSSFYQIEIQQRYGSTGAFPSTTMTIDDLAANGVAVADGAGDQTDVITSDGSVVLHASHPYFLGTTRIWKNGNALRSGNDYTETSPLTGVITLTTTPSVGDTIVVTYVASTGTGGGASFRVL